MLKIAVVEDQTEVRESLCQFIRQYAGEQGLQAEVEPFADGAVIAEGYQPGYDIIFLDVEMPRLGGFGAAERIRAVDPDVVLVFVTNMAQYAIKGYEVDALDYVLKPVSYGAFCTKLSRAIQRVQRRKGGQVALQLSGGGMQLLDTGDILYLETRNRMLYYHTATQEYAVRGSLAGAEKQLAAYHFARCNQCYLVNLQYVRAVELLLSLMALTWLLDPMAQSNSLVQLQVSLLGMYIGFFILLGAMIYACVEIDKKSALYCAVWSLLTAQTAYEGWNLFELLCAVKSHPLNMNSVPVKLLQVLTGVVFYGVICGTLARKIPDKGVYHIGPRQLASAFFMGIMFMLQAALLSSAQALDWPMSVVGTTLIGQLYFLTLLYLQTELFKKSDLQKEMETLNLLYERQRQQYQVARQNVNIINKRCHELRVQIAALRKLAPDAVPRETLEEAENAARLYDAGANSGNEVLDVVLTEKTLLCQSRRVQLNAVANGSCLQGFEPGDLYALFANALDYAIEGAVRTPDPARRNIDLLVCVRQSFIVINVISPAREPEAAATRTEAYELKVLRRIVQKYSGTLTTETQNGFFAIKIIFPLKQGE